MPKHMVGRTNANTETMLDTMNSKGGQDEEKFVSGQVHVKDVRKRSKSLREFDIEEEHRNIMKEFNEDFEIKRVPRPGE